MIELGTTTAYRYPYSVLGSLHDHEGGSWDADHEMRIIDL